MVVCIAEALRAIAREELYSAVLIVLARAGKKETREVVRYRCGTPTDVKPMFPGVAQNSEAGVTAPIPIQDRRRAGHHYHHSEIARGGRKIGGDHAERGANAFADFLRKCCTPMGEECDEALSRHIGPHVRVLAVDGFPPERRCLRGASIQRRCPKVVLLVRDMARAARIAANGSNATRPEACGGVGITI